MGAEQRLGAAFVRWHPEDAARILERLSPEDVAAFVRETAPGDAAEALARVNPALVAGVMAALDPDQGARVISALPATGAAAILRRLPDPRGMLVELPDHLREPIAALLTFPEETAGGLADPTALTVADDITVGEALRQVRHRPAPVAPYVFVVDRGHRLVGVAGVADLLGATAGETVTSVMRREPPSLAARADLRTVASDPGWLEYDVLPVIEGTGTFLGALEHRSVRRRASDSAARAGPIGPLVSLAELYWTGFSRVLFGFGAAAGPVRSASPEEVADDSER